MSLSLFGDVDKRVRWEEGEGPVGRWGRGGRNEAIHGDRDV